MIIAAALAGAVVALALHYWVEYLLNLQEKRRNCPHRDQYDSTFAGYKTRHCRDCGWQETIPRED